MSALGFAWRQQTIARVETGQRPVTAGEILGLALALETSALALLDPSLDDRAVELPSGHPLSVKSLKWLLRNWNDGSVVWPGDETPDVTDMWQAGDYQGSGSPPLSTEDAPDVPPGMLAARSERFARANGYAEAGPPPRRSDRTDTDR